ncbi:MAG TPA: efflux RND transporter periplasmic adaptor subunit [Casimicrobiaceae bacterium]|nr:efflux RND transporter periplasmic adaptor subunit [Casimicrobiaceae bacterium]
MNKAALVVVIVVAVGLAAGGGYWLGTQRVVDASARSRAPSAPDVAKGAVAGAAVTVEAVRVTLQPMPQTITAVGSLRSDESITLRPEVAGRIATIHFQEGQRVTQGAPLVRLDPAINEAELQQARANLKLAQSKYDRAVDLARSNFISSQARDEAENNLRVAEAAVTLAEAKLAKMEIKAPFSGIIGLRVVSAGDYVKEGADMVNLESIDPLKVDFRVPEIYLQQVQVGQTLTVRLDALPDKAFDGKVFAVNPLFDAAGRSMVIRALVRNADSSLRPGMFARVTLITRDQKNALVIPEQAIVPQGDDQYVFRIVDGKALRAKVEVGQRRDAKVEVVKGLSADDVVVTAGQLKLRDGVNVAIAGAASSANTAVKAPPPIAQRAPAGVESVAPESAAAGAESQSPDRRSAPRS